MSGLTHPHRRQDGTFASGPGFRSTVYHGSPRHGLTEILADPPTRTFKVATSEFGAFFAVDPDEARKYAGATGHVYATPLPVQRPYRLPFTEFARFQNPSMGSDGLALTPDRWPSRLAELMVEARAIRERLQADGYDGIVIEDADGRALEIAAFANVAVAKADVTPTGPNGGLYIGRPLVNASQLARWAVAHGIRLVPDPHVTVVFSRADVTLPVSREPAVTVTPDRFGAIEPLGSKGAIVLHLAHPSLAARWQEAQAAGASWDYDSGYLAHLTLTYEGEGVEWSAVTPPDFPLILGPEAAAPIAQDPFVDLFPDLVVPVAKGACDCVSPEDCNNSACGEHGDAVRALRAAGKLESHPGDPNDPRHRVHVAKAMPADATVRATLEARTPHTIAALRTWDTAVGALSVQKLHDEQRLVSGFMLVCTDAAGRYVVDRQTHVVTLQQIAKAAQHHMDTGGTLGVLHLKADPAANPKDPWAPALRVGKVVEALVVTPAVKRLLDLPASLPLGLAGTGYVESEPVWKAVKDGKLAMFSVGGGARGLVPVRIDDPAGPVGRTDRA